MPQPLTAKGWTRPLQLYRPFLSYSELGALVSGQPSKMHDALQAILGLDVLTDTERTLNDSRRSAESESKLAKQGLSALRAKLAEHPDERARAAENALTGRTWDLAALDALTADSEAGADRGSGLLQQVVSLTLPALDDVAAAVARVAEARSAVASLAGTRADEARRLAALLSAALAHQRSHAGEPCPVCGGHVLDDAWVTATEASIAGLTSQAALAEAAHGEEAGAVRALGKVVPPKPMVLRADFGGEIDASAAAGAWDRWTPRDVSAETFAALSTAVDELRSQAAAVLRRRARRGSRSRTTWPPGPGRPGRARTRRLGSPTCGKRSTGCGRSVPRCGTPGLLPSRRPPRVWETLRQQSHVELGRIRSPARARRRVALDVTVDGVEGAALGDEPGRAARARAQPVHPRATAPESPFRFIVVDDPVQSMDPAGWTGSRALLRPRPRPGRSWCSRTTTGCLPCSANSSSSNGGGDTTGTFGGLAQEGKRSSLAVPGRRPHASADRTAAGDGAGGCRGGDVPRGARGRVRRSGPVAGAGRGSAARVGGTSA